MSAQDVVVSGAAGAVAGLFLNLVYFGIQAAWPESYTTVRNVIDRGARGSLIRYGLLRFLPTYVTGTFISVTLARLQLPVVPAITTLLAMHLAFTNVRALVHLGLAGERHLRNPVLVAYHVGTAILLGCTGVLALATRSIWSPLIPGPTELTNALWTGAFAAVVAAAIQRLLRFPAASSAELIRRAVKDVGVDLWERIPETAQNNGSDPVLMQALVAAESLQRPRWLRKAERVKGRIVGEGTYGVAQVSAARPLSDMESIEVLCRRFAGYFPERNEQGYVAWSRFRARIEQHNDNPQFVDQVADFYRALSPLVRAASEAVGSDQRPVIEVTGILRRGQRFIVKGTAIAYEATLTVTAEPADGVPAFVTATLGGPHRGDWSVEVPLATRSLWLTESFFEGEGSDEENRFTAYVDLSDPY